MTHAAAQWQPSRGTMRLCPLKVKVAANPGTHVALGKSNGAALDVVITLSAKTAQAALSLHTIIEFIRLMLLSGTEKSCGEHRWHKITL